VVWKGLSSTPYWLSTPVGPNPSPPCSRPHLPAINNMLQSCKMPLRITSVSAAGVPASGVRALCSLESTVSFVTAPMDHPISSLGLPGACHRKDVPSLDSRLESAIRLLNHRRAPSITTALRLSVHLIDCCNPFLSSAYHERRSTCIRFLLRSTPFANARLSSTSNNLHSTTQRSAFSPLILRPPHIEPSHEPNPSSLPPPLDPSPTISSSPS
jgi:hypothetical protein